MLAVKLCCICEGPLCLPIGFHHLLMATEDVMNMLGTAGQAQGPYLSTSGYYARGWLCSTGFYKTFVVAYRRLHGGACLGDATGVIWPRTRFGPAPGCMLLTCSLAIVSSMSYSIAGHM